ncbi:hypothetical protein ENUP19_0341G0001 [Entamoeba nuttalli]|uniref:Sulfite exporter TauE/SafE protein n=2 Tax=Entamoeba nuttalli TaxID=412467 RepID=K2GUZ3_ENTNP|nr:hypothetical protein ENU1_147930 [Entamoeba nuttalli P19]EKE38923.1 hypothetical protein ENU1_147930 [Entamoeba nuttalli P19]|eukprot:XP_008858742.1 hypothetical protein ENU1_147930 [Entamoeba nuttalli P19]
MDSTFVFDWKLIVGSIGSLFFAVLCAGSGIGGGCFYLVIFVLILQMDPHQAIPLSKITTFGVACGGFLILWMKRHPNVRYKPLISYPTALMVEPLTIYGTMIGVIFNIISPSWLIIIVLVLLLGFTSYKTFAKAIKQWKNENEKRDAAKATELVETSKPDIADNDNDDMKPSENGNNAVIVDERVQEEEEGQGSGPKLLPQDESQEAQKEAKKIEEKTLLKREIIKAILSVGILIVVWAVMFFIVILKGGEKMDSIVGIECGTPWYWVLTAIGGPLMLAVTIVVGIFLWWRQRGEEVQGEVQWTVKNCLIIPIGAFFAGVSAAYLGIGGGMVIGPILLEIGVLPQVATATSAFMIMFTASSSSLQYIIDGKLDIFYGLWYFAIGFIGAAFGQFGFSKIVQKLNRQSIIGFFLGVLIVLSTLAMIAITVVQLVSDVKNDNLGFKHLCKVAVDYFSSSSEL